MPKHMILSHACIPIPPHSQVLPHSGGTRTRTAFATSFRTLLPGSYRLACLPISPLNEALCRNWESNPDARRHDVLSVACLPIPPLRHGQGLC